MRLVILIVAAATLLAGCALSPQTVTLTPTLNLGKEVVAQGQVVSIQVVDERPNSTLGSRGGIYAKTSLIQSGNDVAEAVRAATEQGLIAQGYKVDNAVGNSNTAAVVLKMAITELSYVVPQGPVATGVDMTVALRVTAERADGTHTASYRSAVNRKFPVTPTQSQNEIWISEVLSQTLSRFFADPQMRAFLLK